jgi:hypothetical protein
VRSCKRMRRSIWLSSSSLLVTASFNSLIQNSSAASSSLAGRSIVQAIPSWIIRQTVASLHPTQVFISTTPKPIPLLKRLIKDETCAITRGTTYDNQPNLAKSFFEKTVTRYENTRLGRQELLAEILGDNPDGCGITACWSTDRVSLPMVFPVFFWKHGAGLVSQRQRG